MAEAPQHAPSVVVEANGLGADGAGESRRGGDGPLGGDSSGGMGDSVTGGKRARTCVHFLKGRCKYGDDCRFSHDAEPYAQRSSKKARQLNEQPSASARPTLLQALLSKEIREERSLLLQCIRKLVSNLDADKSASA